VGIIGKVQAKESDNLKFANGGKFELHPDAKPTKSIFQLLATIQVFNPGFINSPDFFTFICGEILRDFRFISLV
jgi:hypothetical protein